MRGLRSWCRKHYKAYVVIVYIIGVLLGFGTGYQVCLEINQLQHIAVSVFALLG